MTGRSAALDGTRHAVRPDLADVRLADRVFAPHYAAPVTVPIGTAGDLRADRQRAAAVLGRLEAGATFELLDIVGDDAWGMAPSIGRAGWIDRAMLDDAAALPPPGDAG